MPHAEKEVVINKPAAAVYAYVADGNNNAKWRPGVSAVSLKSGAPGTVGAQYAQTMKGPGGRDIAGDYTITQAVPGKSLAFEVTAGPARPTGVYSFSGDGQSTTVHFALDLVPKGFMRLMNGMIQKTMVAEVANLDRLKEVLETTPV